MGNQHEPDFLSTETIDLNSLFTRDVASSGTFDLRGLEATSLGKLLQTIPIPALLVDGACAIAFANVASENIGVRDSPNQPGSFALLFADAAAAAGAQALIKKVFATRQPEVMEAALKKGKARLWGRMHLRPLRVGKRRSILVLVEDLTLESNRVLLEQKHLSKLERSQDLIEKRLARNVANLRMANSRLKKEAADRKRAEEALKKAMEQLQHQADQPADTADRKRTRTNRKAAGRAGSGSDRQPENDSLKSVSVSNAIKDFRNFLKLVRSAAQMVREDLEKEDASRMKKHMEKLLKHCAIAEEKLVRHEGPVARAPDDGS
jgi:hypothetical protein